MILWSLVMWYALAMGWWELVLPAPTQETANHGGLPCINRK
jgi:hypothetical protein